MKLHILGSGTLPPYKREESKVKRIMILLLYPISDETDIIGAIKRYVKGKTILAKD